MRLNFAGVSVEISFWFVAVISLFLTLFPESQAIYCFIFCILHETGHLLAMFFMGKKVTRIEFGYFGIKIFTDKNFLPALKEAAVAAGGPVANFFVASILFVAGQNDLAVINLALAFFNLLPVSILDGGHILSALFPENKCLKGLSIAVAVLLFLVGTAVLIYSKTNFTILIVSLYLLTGIVLHKE